MQIAIALVIYGWCAFALGRISGQARAQYLAARRYFTMTRGELEQQQARLEILKRDAKP